MHLSWPISYVFIAVGLHTLFNHQYKDSWRPAGHRWIPPQRPVMRSFDVFFDLCLNKRWSKQSIRRWFETPSLSLWHNCNVGFYFPQAPKDQPETSLRMLRRIFDGADHWSTSVTRGSYHVFPLVVTPIVNCHDNVCLKWMVDALEPDSV